MTHFWVALLDVLPALCLVGAVYCIGGLHGLWLAWSQPARMERYAATVDRIQRQINENEGIPTP